MNNLKDISQHLPSTYLGDPIPIPEEWNNQPQWNGDSTGNIDSVDSSKIHDWFIKHKDDIDDSIHRSIMQHQEIEMETMNRIRINKIKEKLSKLMIESFNPTDTMEDFLCKSVIEHPDLLEVVPQTPKVCLSALEHNWTDAVFGMINIPIEGELLTGIATLRLIKGPRTKGVYWSSPSINFDKVFTLYYYNQAFKGF